PERLAEPLLERALQFLVDRLAHLVELAGVFLLKVLEPRIDGATQRLEPLRDRIGNLHERRVAALLVLRERAGELASLLALFLEQCGAQAVELRAEVRARRRRRRSAGAEAEVQGQRDQRGAGQNRKQKSQSHARNLAHGQAHGVSLPREPRELLFL